MPPRKNKHQGAYEVSVSLSRSRTARDIVLRSINKMLEIANESVKNPEKRSMFEARFLSLEKFVAEFNIEQKQILSILAESDQIDRFIEQDEEISETMQVMCDKINVIAASFKKNVTTIPSPRSENGRAPIQSLILPRIEILKFDGDIVSWRSFRDMFKSLVHENNAYSDIERVHYLRSYLSGPALTVVNMVPLTADNYSIAWTALQNRYENQRLLVIAHFEKLFAFTPLQKESTTSVVFNLCVAAPRGVAGYYQGSRVRNRN